MTGMPHRIVLASASAARQAMLAQAGIAADRQPTGLDEEPIKAELRAAGAGAGEVALALAEAKARAATDRMRPAAAQGEVIVIGADQVLTCGDVWFDKPEDRAAARRQLLSLRGRSHRLTSAVVVLGPGREAWHAVDSADLTMRQFSDRALDAWLQADPDAGCGSVGGYRVEAPAIQLFERLSGDWFTILGLPLLALLDRLRVLGAVPA
ncbi:MAG: Maf family protein [Sneathiellaceae bacterium]